MPQTHLPTRPYRAIHDVWLSSERLARASDPSALLFFMFNQRQDDAGLFPWTPVMVRSLTMIRPWTFVQATKLRDDLASLGVVSVHLIDDEEWVLLRNGRTFNGVPTGGNEHWKKPRFYPGAEKVIIRLGLGTLVDGNIVLTEYVQPPLDSTYAVRTKDVLSTTFVHIEEKRGEEKRGEEEGPSSPPSQFSETTVPEWLQVLSEIPGWDGPGRNTDRVKWVTQHGISEVYALSTASSLAAKWGGPGWKYRDVWRTFQAWVRRLPLPSRGGLDPPKGLAGLPPGHPSAAEVQGALERRKPRP